MFDTGGKIAIAQLAFFVVAIFPAVYCFFKHGKHGLLGWFFICAFCMVRIVGAGIIVSDESGDKPLSEAGSIISSVAIGPLIISIAAIGQESYHSIKHHRRLIFGFFTDVVVHFACSGAIIIIAIGYTKLETPISTADDMKTGLDMIRTGGVILLLIWLGIAAIAIVASHYTQALRGEMQLSKGVAVALIALFVRILYTVLGAFVNSASFNPRAGGTATEKIVLDIIPEFFLTMVLLAAGIASRNITDERRAAPQYNGL